MGVAFTVEDATDFMWRQWLIDHFLIVPEHAQCDLPQKMVMMIMIIIIWFL